LKKKHNHLRLESLLSSFKCWLDVGLMVVIVVGGRWDIVGGGGGVAMVLGIVTLFGGDGGRMSSCNNH
jgi:hypothetical protein